MSEGFDIAPLAILEAQLGVIPAKTFPVARKIVEVGALKVKQGARSNISGSGPTKHLQWAISYDLDISLLEVSAEIGFDKDMTQGPLGNLLEYGSVNNTPTRPLGRALDAEADAFESHVAKIRDVVL